jgi:hypothetical protein
MGAVSSSTGSFALFFLREWALHTTGVDSRGGDGSAGVLVERGADRSSADDGVPRERSASSSAHVHTVIGHCGDEARQEDACSSNLVASRNASQAERARARKRCQG